MLKSLLNRSVFVQAVCVSLVCVVLSMSAPRKAEAGLALIFAGISGALPIAAGVAVSAAGLGMTIGGPVMMGRGCSFCGGNSGPDKPGLAAISVLLLLLDDEAAASDQTESALAQRYSFIEDRTVIGNLAQTIAVRAAEMPVDKNGMKIVRLSRDEITDILAPTDVMENHPEQVEQMIQELR